MKLYHSPFSTNVRKVVMASALLGIDLELVHVDLAKGEQRRPEFLALNRMGRVPVLEDGDFVLSESNAIMAYLADKKPGNTLYPADVRARADVNQWLFWADSHWSPAIGALNMENMLKKLLNMGEPDPVQVKRQEDYVSQFAAALDGHLASADGEWICGRGLTIADLAVAASLTYAVPARLPVQTFANLQAWLSRVQALDAWKRTEPPPFGSSA